MNGFFASLTVIIVIAFVCWIPFWVIPYQTAQGEHTGYVTAIEKTGWFFKTGTAYVKTDTMSSQEDTYCVIDNDVYSQLQQYAASKQHVDLFYVDWLKKGVQNCAGESAIIYKVVAVQ